MQTRYYKISQHFASDRACRLQFGEQKVQAPADHFIARKLLRLGFTELSQSLYYYWLFKGHLATSGKILNNNEKIHMAVAVTSQFADVSGNL